MAALVLAVVGLFGCATDRHPSPYFAADIRPIKQKEIKTFWLGRVVRFETAPSIEAAGQAGVNGFVLAEVVIDSNGRVVEHKIVQSEPNGLFTPAAEQLFRLSRYDPAPENQARVPVRFLSAAFFGNSKEVHEQFRRLLEEKGW